MLFHKIGWLPLIRGATRLICRIRQALASARTHACTQGWREAKKKKHPGEERKRRLLEEVFVLRRAEEAALLVGVLFQMLSLREKRTTSKSTVFVPNCTYEGNCAAASVLCK